MCRFRQIFSSTFCVHTELLWVISSWSSNTYSSAWRCRLDNVAYEFGLTPPAVPRISCSSNFDGLQDKRYIRCFVGCWFHYMFNIARNILVQLPSSFFSVHLVSVHVVYPYNRKDTTAVREKLRFILSDRSDLHMTDNFSITVNAFAGHVLMTFSVKETLLPRYVNLSSSFRDPPFCMEVSSFFGFDQSTLYIIKISNRRWFGNDSIWDLFNLP